MSIVRPPFSSTSLRYAGIAALAGATVMSTVAPAVAAPAAAHSRPAIRIFHTTLTPSQQKTLAANADQRVIVLLRNQSPQTLRGGNSVLGVRADSLAAAEQPVVHELSTLHAANLHSYRFIGAVSATVSKSEETRLASDPAVRAVVPDSLVHLAPMPKPAESDAAGTSAAAVAVNRTPGVCGSAKHPLIEPQGLQTMHVPAANRVATGKGVRVATLADGIDPTIKDFIRANGKRVIFDYRDFTGDGPNAGGSGGEESFGDVSSIASQARQTFDLSHEVNPALPLRKPCDIRIKGVAPGASLAVMKIISGDAGFTSQVLLGLDWAVSHDHVNVLSESFGSNPVPNPGTDPIAVFNKDATAHGVAVVVSSGDAGPYNTIGTSATATGRGGIIGAGATTDYRVAAQISMHGYEIFGHKGFENNNPSTFSSSGFTEYGPDSIDVVAPGEDGWADCSKNVTRFSDCADPFGGTAPRPAIVDFGGTSESAPFTAGVAALVIQAYRQAHHGNTPSPVLTKHIILSSAQDLGIPAQQQGAGLVDAARAVALARSVGSSRHHGRAVLLHTERITTTAQAGTHHTAKITATNAGTRAVHLAPRLRHFGATKVIAPATTVTYNPNNHSLPTFVYNIDGSAEPYRLVTLHVPAGYQSLRTDFTWQATDNDAATGQAVFGTLYDPKGRIASDSEPQGSPNGHGEVEVRNPRAGAWHLILFSRPGSAKYSGPITYRAVASKLLGTRGAVRPAAVTLRPGRSRTFTVHYTTSASPGDRAEDVSFGGHAGSVPVLTESLVHPTVATPGHFSGALTGGNGRNGFAGQELSYQFDVPAGMKDVDADISLADPGYTVIGFLVDPHHNPLDVQSSLFTDLTTTNPDGSNPGEALKTVHVSWADPQPGRWALDLAIVGGSESDRLSTPVTGTVSLNSARVAQTGVPNSDATKIPRDTTATATVTVTNTGNSPRIYYIDPRSAGSETYNLGFLTPTSGKLPTLDGPQALVPPYSTAATIAATSNDSINLDVSPAFGFPEAVSPVSHNPAVTLRAPDLPASQYSCQPTIAGPFKRKVPSGGQFACAAFAQSRTIDDTIAATGGNLWDTATDPNSPNQFDPSHSVVVMPGHSTTLHVSFAPTATQGHVIHGFLAVQSFDPATDGSDDVAHVQYRYTIGPRPA